MTKKSKLPGPGKWGEPSYDNPMSAVAEGSRWATRPAVKPAPRGHYKQVHRARKERK